MPRYTLNRPRSVTFARSRLARALWLGSALPCACGCSTPSPAERAPSERARAVEVPSSPPERLWQRRVVAQGLLNPRGILALNDGSLLVAEAGSGDPDHPLTGRISALRDLDGNGDYDAPGERRVLIDHQPSVNILGRLAVNRDEVFGLADLEAGGGVTLATIADPTKGSTLLELDGPAPRSWSTTHDNANSVTWHAGLSTWFAVQSFANTVIAIAQGGVEREIAKIHALEQGQHSVPAALTYEPSSGGLLVALFSGQRGGDTQGSGVDFVKGSGKIVRVMPESGRVTSVVEGLNAPTDLALGENHTLYVLEFCDDFTDPVHDVGEAKSSVRHAGFERFSGRLLAIDLQSGEVSSIAKDLDLPTHLRVLRDGKILVSVGQGTPGRTIPSPSGPTPLDGRLIELFAR